MSELVLLGLVERAETVLYAQAERLSETNRRLELEYLQRESAWERHRATSTNARGACPPGPDSECDGATLLSHTAPMVPMVRPVELRESIYCAKFLHDLVFGG